MKGTKTCKQTCLYYVMLFCCPKLMDLCNECQSIYLNK